ncbi:MAG: polysaccharide biosynthesis tyrosine autokinase [Blastocatellia bacterium]|nr:polysaccharide biosynthesis tyrosine autokinase [Blastocatellia bacterium]
MYDDNRTALTNVPQNGETRRGGEGYPLYARYPAIQVEKNSVREYWRILSRHKWIILTTLAVLVTIVTIGTMLTRPVYQAEAKVEIGMDATRILPGQRIMEVETANVFNPLFLNTQVDILRSRDLSRRVIQRLNLGDSEEFKARTPETLSDNEKEVKLVNAFQRRYNVAVGRQSRIVSLAFDAYDPKLAADVANAVAQEYIGWSMENRLQGVGTAKEFLIKRVGEAKEQVQKSEEAYAKYLAEHKIISLDDKSSITIQRAEELNRQLAELQNERRTAEALYQRSREVPADELPPVMNDPSVQGLARELSKQKQELANLSAKYQPGFPAVKQVQEQVKQLEVQLAEQKQKIVKNIETQYQVARKREDDLKSAFGQSKGEAIQQNRESVELNMLRQNAETDRKVYEDMQQRLQQAEVESEFRPTNVRIIQNAEVPIGPIKPNKILNIGLSLIIGLGLGIGLAFFREYLNNTINTAEDVERILQLPSLGAIPSLQSMAKQKGIGASKTASLSLSPANGELLSGHESISSYAESYRALRTSLLLSSAEHAPRTMLVTSSHPAEGKTTIVANTAISLAQTGARVIVLDADMRRPRCHKILNTRNDAGLSTYLSRDIKLESVIQEHDIPNLYVMPAGPVPPNPSELLSSYKVRVLIEDLKDQFDHIIIDSPPVIHVTDALILSPHVDGTMLVIKSGHTPREAVLRAKQALNDVNAKVFGVVLNAIDLNVEGYYYNYKYASYYNTSEE